MNLIGFGGVTFTPSSGRLIFALLNSSKVNGLIPDSKYNITVTACIEIACRESEAKQVCKLNDCVQSQLPSSLDHEYSSRRSLFCHCDQVVRFIRLSSD